MKDSRAVLRRAGASALALSLLVSCVTNPVTGKSQLSLVSVEEEKALGLESYGPLIQQSWGRVNDPELQEYVTSVGKRLAAVSHAPGYDYAFTVVNANYDNAFALPGGKVCITRGLLARMTNEDQLAGVLGHETGHVTARHGAAAMTRQMLASGILGVGAAVLESQDVRGAPAIVAAAGIGTQLVLLRYTRDQKRQSDELGMAYMAKAGYNPEGFVESMEILRAAHEREPSKLEALFQSHPVTTERIETGRRRVAALYAEESRRPLRTPPFEQATRQLKREVPAFRVADEGEKAMAAKEYRKAADRYAEAARQAPRQAILPALEGIALLRVGDLEGARRAGRTAVALDPDSYHGRLAAGVAENRLGRHQEAVEDLLAAEKAAGAGLVTSYVLGRSYEALGRKEEAARRYSFVASNAPDAEESGYCRQRLAEWGYATAP